MPSEKFYGEGTVENDGSEPFLTLAWGYPGEAAADRKRTWDSVNPVRVNGEAMDRSGINRLIRSLRRARDTVYGIDD